MGFRYIASEQERAATSWLVENYDFLALAYGPRGPDWEQLHAFLDRVSHGITLDECHTLWYKVSRRRRPRLELFDAAD